MSNTLVMRRYTAGKWRKVPRQIMKKITNKEYCSVNSNGMGLKYGSATPERVTFQRASFERTIFSDCTFQRLTIGAIHHLSECHFSDYQIQRVPISTQPI